MNILLLATLTLLVIAGPLYVRKTRASISLLLIMMFGSIVSFGQTISVTFTGTGAATGIDSVKATNLTLNQSVTLPGNETLVLTGNTGIQSVSELTNVGIVFPNPFSGRATFTTIVQKPQTVYLKIQNLVGQVVAQTKALVQPGENQFSISINKAGIYMITLTTAQGTSSYKVICAEATGSENTVQYFGAVSNNQNNHNNHNYQNNHNNSSATGLKTSQTSYSLGYSEGDILHYRCMSSIYTTIVTDSPTASKNYSVAFVACTDPDGKSYPVVKIGGQTWMAENLAWLPFVSPRSLWSSASLQFLVYDYEGSSISEAKSKPNYMTYGVLYNQEAANTACPSNWHLPSDAEWTTLKDYLGESAGKKLMSTSGWDNGSGDNSSGFSALPGGTHYLWSERVWSFNGLGTGANFATSTSTGWRWIFVDRWYGIYWYETSSATTNFAFSVRCIKDGPTSIPTASFTISPHRGTTSTIFQFDASGSTDIETASENLEVRWNWNGDSIWDTGYGKIKTLSHQYTSPGSCLVFLEVKDADGLVGTASKMVIVGDSIFTDSRDGHEYSLINVGTQTWMAENLAYLPAILPASNQSHIDPYYYVYDYVGNSVSEAKSSANFDTYGVLYNWPAALYACPLGWHLPRDEEWKTLEIYSGMSKSEANATGQRYSGSVGKKMKSTFLWYNSGNGDNSSCFSALPGGSRYFGGSFFSLGGNANFWSASGIDPTYTWSRSLSHSYDGIDRYDSEKQIGMSVRCLKNGYTAPTASFNHSPTVGSMVTNFRFDASASFDTETKPNDLAIRWDWNGDGTWDTDYEKTRTHSHQYPDVGSYPVILEVMDEDGLVDTETKTVVVGDGIVTDSRDGREYVYKSIGTQTWMIENLAFLPFVSPSSTDSGTEKLYHVYKYQGTSIIEAKESDNYKTYGVLYNWPAAMNGESGSNEIPSGIQGICPSGWHLPSDAEWTVLTDFLGPTAGNKMKTTYGWSSGSGDNSSLFTALPGGYRNLTGGFAYLGKNAWFWSTSADGPENALCRYLDGYFDGVVRDTKSRGYGYSVRCVRD